MKKEKLIQLFNQMSLSEKIGQLVQVTPHFYEEFEDDGEVTGPLQQVNMSKEDHYSIGSVLGTHTKEQVYTLQKKYLEKNRMKIPLLFMADVIHGYETIFPIPLAIGASWDPKTAKKIAELSAIEASEAGIHVTFSPMVDMVRDPRWGRVLESTGEDPYLNSQFASAFVEGYQGGEGELQTNFEKIAACVKHFIGYGLSEAGRDYNKVDLSKIEMYQNHLPPFDAAIKAGAKMVMTSFNTVNGIPATGNKKLLKEVLREQLNFDGTIISDWNSVGELITQGVADDEKQAAKLALEAGIDIDMMAFCYKTGLYDLIEKGEIDAKLIDQAVLNILELKNDLGLFEDPYRGLEEPRKQKQTFSKNMQQQARNLASKTFVLLENKKNVLPLEKNVSIGLIGPFANSQDLLGAWSWVGEKEKSISLVKGMAQYTSNLKIAICTKNDEVSTEEQKRIEQVVEDSSVLVVALGETSEETGEGASKGLIQLPDAQLNILKKAAQSGKRVVTVLFNGRPLDLKKVQEYSDAILEAWYPGTEAGNAIADTLFGEVNPSGKLPMSFPHSTGQIPVYYNHIRTGRPITKETANFKYVSKYMDIPNEPLYPFGYGKTYSDFTMSEIAQSDTSLTRNGEVTLTGYLVNEGNIDGEETIQLYLHDKVAETVRPVKELKKFMKLFVPAHSRKQFSFTLTCEDLAYIHQDLTSYADAGEFDVFIGLDSRAKKIGSFQLIEE